MNTAGSGFEFVIGCDETAACMDSGVGGYPEVTVDLLTTDLYIRDRAAAERDQRSQLRLSYACGSAASG